MRNFHVKLIEEDLADFLYHQTRKGVVYFDSRFDAGYQYGLQRSLGQLGVDYKETEGKAKELIREFPALSFTEFLGVWRESQNKEDSK